MSKPMPAAKDKAQETPVIVQEAVEGIAALIEAEDAAESQVSSESREGELATLVKALQARLDQLEGRQAEDYADDDKLFIAKPSGEQWSERRLDVGTKSYVDVQMQATAFYGPFESDQAVSAYLSAKRGKKSDAFVEWEGVRVVKGREKRTIEAKERADRESQGLVPRIPAYFGR